VLAQKIVVLGTGGTIAGEAASPEDGVGYQAALRSVEQLLSALPRPNASAVVSEQVAQVDSKSMGFGVWQALLQRCVYWLAQADVCGIVVTHGTDTLEETAYFLQCVLDPHKPIVLTCAMRPATAVGADGPRNLLDALAVAASPGAKGVVAVCAGVIHGANDVRKAHTLRLDAFSSGDAGPIGYVEEQRVRQLRSWPAHEVLFAADKVMRLPAWPRVEIVVSHAGADGFVVEALVARGVAGIVVAATGNGTVHDDLAAALRCAVLAGVKVWRATRCANGHILSLPDDEFPHANGLTPVKARIALMLDLADA